FFQAEDGIRDFHVTGVQTCALPISMVPNSQLYNRFRFEGQEINNSSLYYSYTVRNVYAFGEAAHHIGGGSAFLNGLISSLSHRLSLVVLHRYYERDFFSLWGQGFAESSETVRSEEHTSELQSRENLVCR